MTSDLRGYVICSYERSGSNYLCQLLASTGRLGRPADFFNGIGFRLRAHPDYPLAPAAQLQRVLAEGSTPNGVYGLKMFCDRLDALAAFRPFERLPQLRFVHLRRDDLLGQAISQVRARQTLAFRSTSPQQGTARYDRAAISAALQGLAVDQARWTLFFTHNGIAPLQLVYENVVADPAAAATAVARHLELAEPVTVDLRRIELAVQRDALNAQWRERFEHEMRDLGRFDALAVPTWPRRLARLRVMLRGY